MHWHIQTIDGFSSKYSFEAIAFFSQSLWLFTVLRETGKKVRVFFEKHAIFHCQAVVE